MSTRCVINFTHGRRIEAKIYRHSDGYPDGETGVLADLQRFFDAVEKQCNGDNRYYDASYLAAKFVVWQAGEYANSRNMWDRETLKQRSDEEIAKLAAASPLNFLSVGVIKKDPSDIEHRYFVDCNKVDGRPAVRHEEVG